MTFPSQDVLLHRYLRRPYKLHVNDHGGNGPVIIFLHGIAASSEHWSELIPLLTPQYRCITIDLVGFGKSPKPQWFGYSMDDHLTSIHYTIRKLTIDKPFILAGHSLGGLLASRYARLNPKTVSRLLLLSPPVYAPLDSISSKAARTRNKLLLQVYRFLRTNPRMTPENIKRLSYIIPVPKSITKYPATRVPFMKTLEQCIETQSITEDLLHTKAAIEIFYGGLDQVIVTYNIRALHSIKNITLHRIPTANHDISKRYAVAVATVLTTPAATAKTAAKKRPGQKPRSSRKPHTS